MPAIPLRKPGLVWFWCFNDACLPDDIARQLRAFAAKGVSVLILHARPGLLVPYAGGEWFDLIRDVAKQCVALGIEPWLYDEDLCPSGNAGGWITHEHPEMMARAIERFEWKAPAPGELPISGFPISDLKSTDAPGGNRQSAISVPATPSDLFVFPVGTLVWAGLVPPAGSGGAPVDLTDRVGVIRRHWEVAPWDSRWYYAATPLYPHPRAISYYPEFAVTRPRIPEGWRLLAFVARPTGRDDIFGNLIDPLNPAATALFLRRTHERYAASLGPMLGREVPAIFTDEPKYVGGTPFTPGMFESFQARHGYDLRPRLIHLFEPSSHKEALTTRLHYRQWCGQRFLESWLKPVADWCHTRGVALVGHISPEEDPVTQAMCVSNLVPTWEHFDLAGIDLIVPAVGDARHPMLNVGAVSAVSAAQQMGKPGVLSETLGASGLECDPRNAARIIAWQVASGVGTVVVHGAFTSSVGLRRHEAPPDFGPDSPRFDGITDIDRGLRPFFEIVRESTQVAPVAILWPIRSFMAEATGWQFDDAGRRKALNDLLLACLEAQVGVQFLDEDMLSRGELRDGRLTVGKAGFTTILIPSTLVLAQRSVEALFDARTAGVAVYAMGEPPTLVESGHTAAALAALGSGPWEVVQTTDLRGWCAKHLPRVVDLTVRRKGQIKGMTGSGSEADADSLDVLEQVMEFEELFDLSISDEQAEKIQTVGEAIAFVQGHYASGLRASRWIKDGQEIDLVMNLLNEPLPINVGGVDVDLKPSELVAVKAVSGRRMVTMRFDPQSVRPAHPAIPQAECGQWAVRFADEADWKELERPLSVYQLRPLFRNPEAVVPMQLTSASAIGGKPVAEWLEYRARIKSVPGLSPAVLVIEPTGIRGRFTLTVNAQSWGFTVTDVDPKPLEIDITAALSPSGATVLFFRLHGPLPYDGIKVAPVVYAGFGAVR